MHLGSFLPAIDGVSGLAVSANAGLPSCWRVFVELIRTPFLHPEMIWGIVPLYFGWFMNELTSDKKSFNTAIQSGFSFLWAGAQWSQIYCRHTQGSLTGPHRTFVAVSFLVTVLVLIVGAVAFISGIRKRFPKYWSFVGHARFGNYFMIAIFPIQSHYLAWNWDRLIAIAAFALPTWLLCKLLFKPLRSGG